MIRHAPHLHAFGMTEGESGSCLLQRIYLFIESRRGLVYDAVAGPPFLFNLSRQLVDVRLMSILSLNPLSAEKVSQNPPQREQRREKFCLLDPLWLKSQMKTLALLFCESLPVCQAWTSLVFGYEGVGLFARPSQVRTGCQYPPSWFSTAICIENNHEVRKGQSLSVRL